jgi:putative sterol carrier protein
MKLESARDVFDRMAAHDYEPRLARLEGTCEVQLDGTDTWSIQVQRGRIRIKEGPSEHAEARLRCSQAELLRMARGEANETMITAAMRGALELEGDIPLCAALSVLLPIADDEEKTVVRRKS